MENGATVEEHINSAIATIGEKLSLRRFAVATKLMLMHSVLTYMLADVSVC